MSKKPVEPAAVVSEIRSDSLLVQGNPVQIGVLKDGSLVALNPSTGEALEPKS